MDEVMRSIAHVYQWPDFAPPTRTLVKQKPESLRRFLGVYELNEGSLYVVRMDGDRLVGNVLGNTPVALLPSSDHELFARDVNVVIDFVVGAEGSATAVRHNINGWERTGQRVEESRARQIVAGAERTAQRIKDQKPASGSDAAIRKLFGGLAIGKADYDSMTPPFAELTRQNLTRLQPIVADLGALKNLTFKSVGDNGADEYDADFEKGALRIYMSLDEQGRIAGVNFVPR
jgi:hypothetical protein